MKKYMLTSVAVMCLYATNVLAQPSSADPQASQAVNAEKNTPRMSLKNLPFPQLKESLLEYSTRRIDDLTKEKSCIEAAQNHKELKACVELTKSNYKKTTDAVNSIAGKKS